MKDQETELDVLGMSCPSCIRHVNAAIGGLNGVRKVEVRLRDGKVIVRHDPSVVAVSALVAALNAAGYETTPSAAA